jgi:hypothetical protein
MKTITLFDKSSGALGRVLTLPESAIERNVPAGFGYLFGSFDRTTHRVNVTTGQVVHDEALEAAHAVETEKKSALAAIVRAERESQPRAVREALLALLPDGDEKRRLQDLEDEIAQHRERLKPR